MAPKFHDERLDSAATVFFNRELEHIEARALEVKHAQLKGLQFVQVLPGLEATDMQNTYRVYDGYGQARRAASPSDDAPTVNVAGTETTTYFQNYHLAFEYSMDEVEASARIGRPLDRLRADMCRKGLNLKLDDIIAFGDSSVNLTGLLNLSGTNTYTLPADGGVGNSKLFNNKTPDQIIRDFNAMIDATPAATAEIETVKRVVMPPSLMRYLEKTPRSATTDTTIMKFLRDNNPGVEWMTWDRCILANGGLAGTGTADRILCYAPDIDNVRLLLPRPFEQLAPDRMNMGWKITQRFKTGGVISPYPKSILYVDDGWVSTSIG